MQMQNDLRMIILMLGQPVQGMLENRQIGRAVGSQFRRAQEGRLRPKLHGQLRRFPGHPWTQSTRIAASRLDGRGDAIGDQRIARKWPDVFAWNPL